MKDYGLVSIIMPSYNVAKYIGESIDSVLNQSYSSWELIIIDDCSTDNTCEIVNSYNDKRIILKKNDVNSGAAISRNVGIKVAKGKWIAFLDSDDLWEPQKLEMQIKCILNNNTKFCYTSYDMIDYSNNRIGNIVKSKTVTKYKDLLIRTYIATSTVMVEKTIILDGFPLRKTGQDYAMWLELLRNNDAYGIESVLVHIKRRNNSLSKNKFQNVVDVWEAQTVNEKIPKLYAIKNVSVYCINAIKKVL